MNGWNLSINKHEHMNEYIKLLRDSPVLLKRSFLYSQELEKVKEKEKEKYYDLSLQGLKSLFEEDIEYYTSNEPCSNSEYSNKSWYKALNEQIFEDVLSETSDYKHQNYQDDLDIIENNSANDDVMNYLNSCKSNEFYK